MRGEFFKLAVKYRSYDFFAPECARYYELRG